jgi:GDSL-like Lipase/Acylhydrolase/FG-GAP-like repeat
MWHLVIGLRSVTKLVLPLISAAILICLSEKASAQIFNQVIVFGDSNVDAGYYKLLSNPSGNATYNSLWPSAVAAGAGAPTTNPGLVKSQVLAALFGLTANPANTPGGTNYATSGAKNVTINNAQTGGFTAAIPTVTQISNYLNANGGKANSQALYLVYSGSNDVSYATGGTGNGPYPANPQAYVTQAANQLATAIATLSAAGAKTIIVADLDYSFGATNVMQLRLLYTQTLWNQLTTLGVPFLKGDANAARLAIVANSAKYGFTFVDNNTGHVACTEPTGITTAWALLCSSNPAAPSTLTSPNAAQTDLFADDQHFATSGQSLLGNYFYRLIVPYTATHDLNGDGKSDLLWLDTSGNIGLWLMNGASTLSTSVIGNVPGMWSVVGQRDFNDDGKSDILWRDTAGDVAMWLMNGPSVQSSAMIGNVPTNWSVAGTGDFNGDGYGDILWRDTAGNVGLWLMKGTSVQQAVVVGNVPVTWVVVGADLYGNIFWRNSATGEVGMWVMAGTAIAQSVDFGVVPLTWTVAGIGDFDGNGSTDILWRDASGNVGIWLMNGTQVMSTAVLGNVPLNWTIVQTGDYNGDGKSDILWTDNRGDVGMWLMNGASVSSTAILGNVGPSWTVQSLNAD